MTQVANVLLRTVSRRYPSGSQLCVKLNIRLKYYLAFKEKRVSNTSLKMLNYVFTWFYYGLNVNVKLLQTSLFYFYCYCLFFSFLLLFSAIMLTHESWYIYRLTCSVFLLHQLPPQVFSSIGNVMVQLTFHLAYPELLNIKFVKAEQCLVIVKNCDTQSHAAWWNMYLHLLIKHLIMFL